MYLVARITCNWLCKSFFFLKRSTKSVTRKIRRITSEWRLIMVYSLQKQQLIYTDKQQANINYISYKIMSAIRTAESIMCRSCQTCSVKHCRLPWEVFSLAAITGHMTHQEECYCAAGPRQHDVVTRRLEEKPSSKGRNHSKCKHK